MCNQNKYVISFYFLAVFRDLKVSALPPGRRRPPRCKAGGCLGCSSYPGDRRRAARSNQPGPQTHATTKKRSQSDRQTDSMCLCAHPEAYRCDQILRNFTDKSFSAVGLFFGFLVRDTLTKLWKLVDLKGGDGLVFNEPIGAVSPRTARLTFRSPTICFCLLALEAGSCSLTSGTKL